MAKLFGTDGIRGLANLELTPEIAFSVGKAAAYELTKMNKHTPKIIVGMDTRLSCDFLEAALCAGMCSVSAEVLLAGVIPTPAIAYLVKKYDLDAGVMISASHNPFYDNGIKIFNADGYKLADSIEEEIEELMLSKLSTIPVATHENIGRRKPCPEALSDYIEFLVKTAGGSSFEGVKVGLDCANGATSNCAEEVFKTLGAAVSVIHNAPNGININKDCGSTHIESLSKFVVANKLDLGVAFDGDGDRCLIVDENGKLVDGDEIMSICAMNLKEKGLLNQDTIVTTVMSNLGLFKMCEKNGINVEQTAVGDRYVLERMLKGGFNLGGEQSGHVIFLDHNTTGDGLLTAINVVKIIKERGEKLSKINSYMQVLPQVLVNAKVGNSKKFTYESNETIQKEIAKIEQKMAQNGRVLIRPSGTEPVIRVMLEGVDREYLLAEATRLAKLFETCLQD